MENSDPNVHKNTGFKRVVKALFYSFDGIASTLKHEAAFRQEAILAALLIPASFLMRVSLVEHIVLVATILLVMIIEES